MIDDTVTPEWMWSDVLKNIEQDSCEAMERQEMLSCAYSVFEYMDHKLGLHEDQCEDVLRMALEKVDRTRARLRRPPGC